MSTVKVGLGLHAGHSQGLDRAPLKGLIGCKLALAGKIGERLWHDELPHGADGQQISGFYDEGVGASFIALHNRLLVRLQALFPHEFTGAVVELLEVLASCDAGLRRNALGVVGGFKIALLRDGISTDCIIELQQVAGHALGGVAVAVRIVALVINKCEGFGLEAAKVLHCDRLAFRILQSFAEREAVFSAHRRCLCEAKRPASRAGPGKLAFDSGIDHQRHLLVDSADDFLGDHRFVEPHFDC